MEVGLPRPLQFIDITQAGRTFPLLCLRPLPTDDKGVGRSKVLPALSGNAEGMSRLVLPAIVVFFRPPFRSASPFIGRLQTLHAGRVMEDAPVMGHETPCPLKQGTVSRLCGVRPRLQCVRTDTRPSGTTYA